MTARPGPAIAVRILVVSDGFQAQRSQSVDGEGRNHCKRSVSIEIVLVFCTQRIPKTGRREVYSRLAHYIESLIRAIAKLPMPPDIVLDVVVRVAVMHRDACAAGQ